VARAAAKARAKALRPAKKPFNRAMAMVYLPLLLGICEFTNVHVTLVQVRGHYFPPPFSFFLFFCCP
jgi:hypothetical protein